MTFEAPTGQVRSDVGRIGFSENLIVSSHRISVVGKPEDKPFGFIEEGDIEKEKTSSEASNVISSRGGEARVCDTEARNVG